MFLLDSGTETKIADLNNWTPLHLAIHGSHEKAVKRLLEMDGDINALNDQN